MSQNNPRGYAALGIACIALALSIYTAVRGSGDDRAGGKCVDQEARDQAARLRQTLADRDAVVARLARTVTAQGGGPAAAALAAAAPATPPPDPGPRRYTHFEIPNPAVSVTQKDDGTYDIRTTDPALAGSVMQVTAVTSSGDEDKLLIRIPQ
jgi:hypothetical protein